MNGGRHNLDSSQSECLPLHDQPKVIGAMHVPRQTNVLFVGGWNAPKHRRHPAKFPSLASID